MRKESYFKVAGYLTASLLLTGTVLTNDTYSLYTKSQDDQMAMETASAENLVTNVQILTNLSGGKTIQIIRDSEYGYRPDVGIAVEGTLANYVKHINPIRIDENGLYEIPIEPNLNVDQYTELLIQKYVLGVENIYGVVIVKNFDGKVIHDEQIEVSIDYLLNHINNQSDYNLYAMQTMMIYDEQAIAEVTDLIVDIANKLDWQNGMTYTENSSPANALSSQQIQILQTITPNLIESINNQYAELERLKEENANLQQFIDNLLLAPIEPPVAPLPGGGSGNVPQGPVKDGAKPQPQKPEDGGLPQTPQDPADDGNPTPPQEPNNNDNPSTPQPPIDNDVAPTLPQSSVGEVDNSTQE